MLAEFIRIWLTWIAMILAGAAIAALWAARAGHFRDQQRARSLALWAAVEEEKPNQSVHHRGTENTEENKIS